MKRLLFILAILLTLPAFCAAKNPHVNERIKYKQGPSFIYRLYLTDKKGTPYTLNHPNRFLSRRSIERRKRQQLPIDSTDLPVNPRYLRLIEQRGVNIIGQSRWQNTVLVRLKDSTLVHHLEQLACVRDSKLVWIAPDSITPTLPSRRPTTTTSKLATAQAVWNTAKVIVRYIYCKVTVSIRQVS